MDKGSIKQKISLISFFISFCTHRNYMGSTFANASWIRHSWISSSAVLTCVWIFNCEALGSFTVWAMFYFLLYKTACVPHTHRNPAYYRCHINDIHPQAIIETNQYLLCKNLNDLLRCQSVWGLKIFWSLFRKGLTFLFFSPQSSDIP